MSYGGKKMLMPGAQKNPSAASKIVHPFFFVFDLDSECRTVETNKPVKERMELFRLNYIFEFKTHQIYPSLRTRKVKAYRAGYAILFPALFNG
jgi:hypothetical protein